LIRDRADVGFAASALECARLFASPKYPLRKLGELCALVQYGCSALSSAEPKGWPIIRMNNLQQEGWDFSDLKYYAPSDEEAASYRVERGDILFNRTNGSRDLVGKCEVFDEPGDWLFASYLIRIRVNRSMVRPQFISQFLNTRAGRALILRSSRQILMSNINAQEIRALDIPLPGLEVQAQLEAKLTAAKAERERKLAEADALLTSFDGWLLEQLQIAVQPIVSRGVFAIRLSQAGLRFDPHFHGPQFKHITDAIEAVPHARLGTLAELSPEIWSPDGEDSATFRYIEISGVSPRTGEAVAVETSVADAPSRARLRVRNGNIIVSLTRPHHGSIAMIDQSLDGCIASTGFAVLNHIPGSALPIYLWCILRSQLCLKQMLQRSSGGNYPAITEAELENILIPLPKADVQKRIVAEVIRRRDAARRLRTEAAQEWAATKAWFESELLGRPATAERNS
jgi:restriction endonuclease S subunit